MKALTMFEASPSIRSHTAKRICEIINNDMPHTLKDKMGFQGSAITIHVWQGSLDKEITNENDAQQTIRNLEKVISDYKLSI